MFSACCLSGLAGVYFEKILKKPSSVGGAPPQVSIWVRNIQLAFFGVMIAGLTILGKDGSTVMEKGFFHGYNSVTFWVIFCQATGGLIVAMVVKYADNVLKGFATSIAIILSSIASLFLFDFQISLPFLMGSAAVMYATFLYDSPAAHNKITANTPFGGYCPRIPFFMTTQNEY